MREWCQRGGESQSSKYRSTASAARVPKELNSSLNGKVNSTGVITLSGRTRTVIVTSVSSTTQTFHFRPLDSMVRLFVSIVELFHSKMMESNPKNEKASSIEARVGLRAPQSR